MNIMKNTIITAITASVIALVISAFTHMQSSSIKGTVNPADKAVRALAIPSNNKASNDSVSAPITNGNFEIQNLKAGDYSLMIQAMAPYGNATKVGVTVQNGKSTDVGEIQLQQK
jgi:hypothetical protein